MNPVEIIAIIAIVLVVGLATAYIIRVKKRGKGCIGCPDAASCRASKCYGKCSSCEHCESECDGE